MDRLLLQLEQQLAVLSGQLGVAASLLVTGASVVVIALSLLRAFPLRSARSTAPASGGEHQAGGGRGGDAPLGAPAGLPAPEQLARLIQERRSIFPKDYTGAIVADSDLQVRERGRPMSGGGQH